MKKAGIKTVAFNENTSQEHVSKVLHHKKDVSLIPTSFEYLLRNPRMKKLYADEDIFLAYSLTKLMSSMNGLKSFTRIMLSRRHFQPSSGTTYHGGCLPRHSQTRCSKAFMKF